MALPSSGEVSFNNINTEIGYSATAQVSLNDADVRALFTQSSGAVDMNTGRGKSWRQALTYTFGTNTTNASLNVTSISGYIAGRSDIVINVNAGVYLWSNSTSTPGLTLAGGTAGDTVTLVNNGFIMGMGGDGGYTGSGFSGGTALQLGYPTTVNNTNAAAYIGGGGGGGGGFGSSGSGGGGGAGGGTGGISGSSAAGAGGGIGASGANAPGFPAGGGGGGAGGGGGTSVTSRSSAFYGGGGGGRIFPGTGGAGGTGDSTSGAGGSANNAGGSNTIRCGGGGGWGASGGTGNGGRTGGAGGRAVYLNGQTVTWVSGDTTRIYGAVSN
jgi:hypothetical protein